MRIRLPDRLPGRGRRGAAVAIGNFDGLHLGHQKILRLLIQEAQRLRLAPLVLTFSPHPEKVLSRGRISMIQTLPQRLAGIMAAGAKTVLIASFDKKFSRLSCRNFAEQILADRLRAKEVVVGADFRFGKNREGNVSLLKQLGCEFGFEVRSVPPARKDGRIVSSSRIRALLLSGCVQAAARLLGNAYEIQGEVIRGDSRGKALGFPTANILTSNEIIPPGVHITETIVGRTAYPSLTNIGTRPTFGSRSVSVESFLIGFRGSLYGKKVRVRFFRKIRDERKFKTEDELSSRIRRDIAVAGRYFRAKKRLRPFVLNKE